MKVSKQFLDVEKGVCRLVSHEDAFVPEMSLPIEAILQQFSFVDNVRVADMVKSGFENADDNEDDFDVEDFDTLDIAEREALYNDALQIVEKYRQEKQRQEDVIAEVVDPMPASVE